MLACSGTKSPEGGGFAAAYLPGRAAQATGPPPPASRVLRIALRAHNAAKLGAERSSQADRARRGGAASGRGLWEVGASRHELAEHPRAPCVLSVPWSPSPGPSPSPGGCSPGATLVS